MAAIAPRLVRSFSSSAGHLQMIKPPIQLFGLEGRYATALYSASVKEKKLEAVEKELLEFQGLLKKDQKLKEFLLNPTLKRNIKKEALLSVFKKQNTSSISSNFFNAIADNGRMNRVESMINAFKTIMSAHRGEVQCEVTTAKPLDKAMEQELHEALKGFLKSGQKLLLHTKVDPSIIGGMIIAVGDKYVDMSMSSKIKKYNMTSMEDMRVLSIQSHVVHGYVGNRCAVFPLQTLGLEVDVINSVDFSNHTGYGLVKGRVLSDMELGELIQGLMANGVANYTHLLTGYVGCPRFLRRIVSVVGELRKLNPDLVYLCDPVLGDNGQLYVPESLLPIYIEEVIPLATIVTPNQYEAELLSGITITTRADAIRVLDFFHEKGVSIVIISSTDLLSPDTLLLLASQKNGEKKEQIEIAFPCLESSFTGTGDTFAAIFLAFYSSKGDFKLALELTVGCMQEILKRTLSYAKKLAGEGREPTKKELELRLIQSRDDILNPKGYPGTSIILS